MRLQWIIGVILLEKSMKKLHSMKRKEIKSLRRCRMKELARDVTDVLYTLNIVICIAFKKTLIYILQIKHVIIIKNVTLFCTIYPPINIAWISLLSS